MRGPVNVLVVDDVPVSLLAMEATLASSEIHVIKASSGNEALARLLETEFACIILDVRIPDIDGFELARIIRGDEKTRYLPIIFVSGQLKNEHDIFRGYEIGAFDYLIKPVDPVIVKGKVNVFAELFRKERERRRAQEALLANESRTRAIISNATDAFIAVDSTGTITEWNHAAEHTFGWERSDVIGKPMADIIIPHRFRNPHLNAMDRFLATGESNVLNRRVELSALHRNGREFPVEISISEISNDDKISFFAFIHDISERKTAEMEIRTAKEELERRVNERTRALTEQTAELKRSNEELARFAYVSSHDLKEPLRMVLMYTQLLQAEVSDLTPEAKEFLNYVVEGSSRMAKLIDDLLIYARVGRGNENIISVDLTKLLDKVMGDLGAAIKESHAKIKYQNMPTLEMREAQISQVFQNLITNAIKFRGEDPPRVEISAKEMEKDFVFSVKDHGIGIDEKYHTKIFEIFQRLHTREAYPGTGIGLSVCKKIIELHGGNIWVESELGHGASFHFTLPKNKDVRTLVS